MQKAETKEKETSLVLVGHFHHQAVCACGAVTTVETYYEQLPPILCPACQKENTAKVTHEKGLFVAREITRCVECQCRYTVKPAPPNPTCPTCSHPAIEVADGNKAPSQLQKGQT